MRRLAIWTGWSFAPKRRALHPSINRLTKDSSRSMLSPLQLYHFRTDEDDQRRYVDPGEHDRGKGDRSVHREHTEAARDEAERDLRKLPQHGGYQRRHPRRAASHPHARDVLVDEIERHITDGEAEERCERTGDERDDQRDDTEDDKSAGEEEGVDVAADEP